MRWKLAAGVAALVTISGCVPPPPDSLSHDFAVTAVHAGFGEFVAATTFEGTITNTGVTPADYTVTLVGSSGQTGSDAVLDVLVGQTAVWMVTLTGSDVTITQTAVRSAPAVADPVSALSSITSQRPHPQLPTWLTEVRGVVTNTGTSIGSFVVELQANTGAVTTATAYDVPPDQTVEWATIFVGQGTARIVRTTTLHPSP